MADPYLAFWFSCLHAHQTEIDAPELKRAGAHAYSLSEMLATGRRRAR